MCLAHAYVRYVRTCYISLTPLAAYKRPDLLRALLATLARQQTEFAFEVIIGDNGCFNESKLEVSRYARLSGRNVTTVASDLDTGPGRWACAGRTSVCHLLQCDNLGYAKGNNRAASFSSMESPWLLFLNDDLQLLPRFVQSLYDLARLRGNADAGAVGCKVVTQDGTKLLEAGSILWRDGSALGYGRDSSPHATEYTFARTVDYVSGACLLIQREAFLRLGGFPTTYEAY